MRLASRLLHTSLPAIMLVVARVASAAVPNPATSTHDPCFVACPLGDITYHVTVRDVAGNPIQNSTVALDFSQCGFVHCTAQGGGIVINEAAHQVLAVTGTTGTASFPLGMGGCCPSVRIFADGVLLATVSMTSPDQDSNLIVNGADNSIVTALVGSVGGCADLDCDGSVTAADVGVVVAHNGHTCTGVVPTRPRTWGTVKTIYR
ncbi:MAG: hypothetical protein ACHQ52_09845 [Candidatus Eisenbacteria bacterium]